MYIRLFSGLLAVAVTVPAQVGKAYVSSTGGDRLALKSPITFSKSVQPGGIPFQIRDTEQQKMFGFGASFMEAGMISLSALKPADQEGLLRALFDPDKGAGFSAMKSPIGATDFMSAGPWYTYNDTPGDTGMKHFSIARDLRPTGVVPFIKRARKHGQFILQCPMDYPPDWMLFDVNTNQDVDPKCFDSLALYYLRFVQEYAKQGVEVDYLSLFNEPGVYTKIPYEKIRDLLKNHVGPLFAKSGVRTRLQACEPSRRAHAHKGYPVILDDPEARKYVANMPYHGYDFSNLKKEPTKENGYTAQEFELIRDLHKRYPDLRLWMTEVCFWNGGTPWAKPLPRTRYEDADFWVNQIASDIEAGSSGWTYWNMILDQDGGPWLVSPVHGNPEWNQQQPVVIVDRDKQTVSYTGVYYALAHFSKFVRPDSVKLATEGGAEGVRCLAFRRPDGAFVAQLINSRKTEARVSLAWRGMVGVRDLPPVSITTLVWN